MDNTAYNSEQDPSYESIKARPNMADVHHYESMWPRDKGEGPGSKESVDKRNNFYKGMTIGLAVVCVLLACVVGFLTWWCVTRSQNQTTGELQATSTNLSTASTTIFTTPRTTEATTDMITTTYPEHYEARDCLDHKMAGYTTSGVYGITIGASTSSPRHVDVYCDMTTDGGGWTVLLKREDGSVPFSTQYWNGYKNGFGMPSGEYYLGNDNMHLLTMKNGRQYEIRIDLTSDVGLKQYAVYSMFTIEDETNKYRLTLGTHSGTLADSFTFNNNQKFSTWDQDNDSHTVHCARMNPGGWWYNACSYCKLASYYDAIRWNGFNNSYIPYADMKIRPTETPV